MTHTLLSLVALQSGGYTHPWGSGYVLGTLIVGIVLIIAFALWEWKGAKLPIVPRELFQGQRTIGVSFLLSFVAGMNFYSLINCEFLESTFVNYRLAANFVASFPSHFRNCLQS
jgi:hypothetical protein